MGFRNPITSLRADQITGQLEGTQIAADAIDGKVITGATVQTAASGPRVALEPGWASDVHLYVGDAQESAPGTVRSALLYGGGPADLPATQITSPRLNGHTDASLTLHGASRDGSGSSQAVVTAGEIALNGPTFATELTVSGKVSAGVPVSLTPFSPISAVTGSVVRIGGHVIATLLFTFNAPPTMFVAFASIPVADSPPKPFGGFGIAHGVARNETRGGVGFARVLNDGVLGRLMLAEGAPTILAGDQLSFSAAWIAN